MKNHPIAFYPLAILFSLSFALISPAQEAEKEPVQAEAKQDLYKKALGYWVLDLDSAEIKAIIASMGVGQEPVPPELIKELEDSTYEFKPSQMLLYAQTPKGLEKGHVKITIKSQDLEKQIVHGDFEIEGDKSMPGTIQINDDRLVLIIKKPRSTESLGMKRIDEETFKKRVPEPKDEQPEEKEQEQQAIEYKDGYPVATPVPNKPRFVFSPYNQSVIDVGDYKSGTLVADPHFQPSEKKLFWVP